ncbi:MAG: hypothetical protein HZC49_13340 [Nitrospirae bacterium]|nr:hypothetical protein [Nitrospirota bacterium]
MMSENKKSILFVLYIVTALILAVIYFSVPERKEFLEFNIRWWKELWQVLGSSYIRLVI